MSEIKLTKRYPLSRTEDITDAYMRGWNDALDAVQNGKFHIAEQTEPQTERIKTLDYCDICNHKGCDNCIANNLDDYCVPSGYEPITQTETQNSNLTFEKQTEASDYVNHLYTTWQIAKTEPTTEDCSMVDPLHDDCFDCDKFFTCDNKGEDYKTDCPWK